MSDEELDALFAGTAGNIIEIFEPDEWGPKKRVEPFTARLEAVEAELRELVRKVLEGKQTP